MFGSAVVAVLALAQVQEPLPASPRFNIRTLVPVEAWPAEAYARRQAGETRFRLSVAPNGRVTGCAVVAAGPNPELEQTVCDHAVARGRFIPARNAVGMPVASDYETRLVWTPPS